MTDKEDKQHIKEWTKYMNEYKAKSKDKNDMWAYRARACEGLLSGNASDYS